MPCALSSAVRAHVDAQVPVAGELAREPPLTEPSFVVSSAFIRVRPRFVRFPRLVAHQPSGHDAPMTRYQPRSWYRMGRPSRRETRGASRGSVRALSPPSSLHRRALLSARPLRLERPEESSRAPYNDRRAAFHPAATATATASIVAAVLAHPPRTAALRRLASSRPSRRLSFSHRRTAVGYRGGPGQRCAH